MDPAAFDEAVFATQLLQTRQNREATIFAATYSPDGEYLVCATSVGKINIWHLTKYLKHDWSDSVSVEERKFPHPALSFTAHRNSIYCLAFTATSSGPVLLSGSDEELMGWRWQDLLAAMEPNSGNIPHCCMNLSIPQISGMKGFLSPLAEVNGLAANDKVYMATGDNNAYAWDLETQKCVGKMAGHKDYLHCIACLPGSQLAVTGAEDGKLGIWDVRTFDSVAFCETPHNAKCTKPSPHVWVSSIAVDPTETWVVCGGGTEFGRAKATGQISSWYLPSQTMTASVSCAAAVQDLTLFEDEIISVGSEPVISRWSRHTGELKARMRATPPSLFAVAINPIEQHQVLSVCGSCPFVDVYADFSSRAFSLFSP